MSWQRRIMTGLENQILASLYAVVFSDPLPAFKCRDGEFHPLGHLYPVNFITFKVKVCHS